MRALVVDKGSQLLPSGLGRSGVPVPTLYDLIDRRGRDGRRIGRKRSQMASKPVLWMPVLLCCSGVPGQALLANLVSEDGAVRGDVRRSGLVQTARDALGAVHACGSAVVVDVVVTPTQAAVVRTATD
jgi:hypothetical protein